jgi:hypothetical protein
VVQFWARKEVIFVHYCILQFAYCAVVVVGDFDAVEVCCETVVACVEPEVCDCMVSGFVFAVFPCGFDGNVARVHSIPQAVRACLEVLNEQQRWHN